MAPQRIFNGSDGTPVLSDGEQRMVKAVLEGMQAIPTVDWKIVATRLSLKDGKCAKERWRQVATKRGWTGSPARARTRNAANSVPAVALEEASGSGFAANSPGSAVAGSGNSSRITRSGAVATSTPLSDMSRAVTNDPDPASSSPLRNVNSGRVTKESKPKTEKSVKREASVKAESSVKKETAVKQEARAKRESSVVSVASADSVKSVQSVESDSRFKTAKNYNNDKKIKPEPRTIMSRTSTDNRGIKKEGVSSDDDVVEIQRKDHEEAKRSKVLTNKKDDDAEQEDDDDDGFYGEGASLNIRYGHPNHCMNFSNIN